MNPDSISLVIAAFSLVGTVLVAVFNVRSAHVNVSDKIAVGSSQLIDEIQEARKRDKILIQDLQKRIDELEAWKKSFTDFVIVSWAGSKRNEEFILSLGIDPPFKVPDFPFVEDNHEN